MPNILEDRSKTQHYLDRLEYWGKTTIIKFNALIVLLLNKKIPGHKLMGEEGT